MSVSCQVVAFGIFSRLGLFSERKPTYDVVPLFHANGLCGHQSHDDLKTCELDTIICFIVILTGSISVAGVFGLVANVD